MDTLPSALQTILLSWLYSPKFKSVGMCGPEITKPIIATLVYLVLPGSALKALGAARFSTEKVLSFG
ncbi:MAG TPA: hypothetical protein VMW34_04355, partial [Anaerolineales bacterium]|nr:hypothetical protein [Anaerolineales bacterium]